MCIVFLYFDDNPGPNGYKLVIAANRDEFYERPAKPAAFWETNSDVIGGVDLLPGKEGGTWLGISKTGQLGILTNYRQSPELISDGALGRGRLATDFLNSSKNAKEYIDEIQSNGSKYNGFNLLIGELSFSTKTKIYWCCNMEDQTVQQLSPGFHGLSNRLLDFPWPKLVYGKERFAEIVKTAENKQDMVNDLLELLNEKRRHFPDEDDTCYLNNPLDQNYPVFARDGCRAIFVHLPQVKYGTRTKTVIVVDASGHGTFIEKTMKDGVFDPLNADNWTTSHHEFDMLDKTHK